MQSLIPESLRLLVVGLNHRTAPLALRETVAFNPQQCVAAMKLFHQRFPHAELAILSTCNRVEFYLARPISNDPSVETLGAFIAEFHKLPTHPLRAPPKVAASEPRPLDYVSLAYEIRSRRKKRRPT